MTEMTCPLPTRTHTPHAAPRRSGTNDLPERLEERVDLFDSVVVNERDADDAVLGGLLDGAEVEARKESGGVELRERSDQARSAVTRTMRYMWRTYVAVLDANLRKGMPRLRRCQRNGCGQPAH